MSFNRLNYDTCAYKQNLYQSVGPGEYRLTEPPNTEDICFAESPHIRLTHQGVSVPKDKPLAQFGAYGLAIDAGTAKLIGTDPKSILRETGNILINKKAYQEMSKAINPFGDGKASERILKICKEFLNI